MRSSIELKYSQTISFSMIIQFKSIPDKRDPNTVRLLASLIAPNGILKTK